MIKKYDFEPGDLISVEDSKYIVVKNYGKTGLVKEYSDNGMLINHFNWKNKVIIKLEDKKISDAEIDKILQELNSFF